jgi:hypothetical protein
MCDSLNKIAIIGVDALEYDYVDTEFLALKGVKYERMEIPENCRSGPEPLSPEIWATLLTGQTYEEHGWSFKAAGGHKTIKRPFLKADNLLKRFGIGNILPSPSKLPTFLLKYKTIFDFVPKTEIVKMPTGWKLDFDSEDIMDGELMNSVKEKHKFLMMASFNKARKNWDMFFTFINILDYVGHIYWNFPLQVKSYYEMVHIDISFLLQIIPRETIVVIVSDAFVSINKNVDVELPTNVLDFYNFIKELVK